MYQKIKKERGITLIVLVITIIVLIILVRVIINLALGNGGILNKTQKIAEEYAVSKMDEENKLNNAENYIDSFLLSSRDEQSTIINNFDIELVSKTNNSITVKVNNVTTNNDTKVKAFIFLLNNETYGTSESGEYTFKNLTRETKYMGICAYAVDKDVKLKKSSNVLEETTYKGEPTALIPIMTSNTTPRGEVTYSTVISNNRPAYWAFNGVTPNANNGDGYWAPAIWAQHTQCWICYDFKKNVEITNIKFRYASQYNEKFTIKIFNDGVWNDIYIGNVSVGSDPSYPWINISLDNPKVGSSIKIDALTGICVGSFQCYGYEL